MDTTENIENIKISFEWHYFGFGRLKSGTNGFRPRQFPCFSEKKEILNRLKDIYTFKD